MTDTCDLFITPLIGPPIQSLLLAKGVAGVDFFAACAFIRNRGPQECHFQQELFSDVSIKFPSISVDDHEGKSLQA